MSKETFSRIQQQLQDAGLYEGEVDGMWGPLSQSALDAAMALTTHRCEANVPLNPSSTRYKDIAWSAKVSDVFLDRTQWIVDELGMPKSSGASDLMACMAWESGETFRPDVRNGAGSGATGLIQFMPATAIVYFYTQAQIAAMSKQERKEAGIDACNRLAKLSAEDQLNYVYRYFMPYKNRLKNLGDLYLAILWPLGIGKADNWVLWNQDERPTTYLQNKGLDVNKDGAITRGECLIKVTEKLTKGMRPEYRRA